MEPELTTYLDPPVDPARDHVQGPPTAQVTLVEYGSYACSHCHAARQVVTALKAQLGDRLRYVFRHRPASEPVARQAAELAEFVCETTGAFWPVHEELMALGPTLGDGDLDRIAAQFCPRAAPNEADAWTRARERVDEDIDSAYRSGTSLSPTFFLGQRRYQGPWDVAAMSEAVLGSVGHRLHTVSTDFAQWAPSTGLLLSVASLVALVAANSPFAEAFEGLWQAPVGIDWGAWSFSWPLQHWINHGLLSVFFLHVGLEIKREFTVGRLATRRAAALPIAAAVGGMVIPALLYLLIVPPGPTAAGWGVPIATDTAFALALVALLGHRVPVELRVFLTAAVVVDDLVAIAVVALFYTGAIGPAALLAAVGTTLSLIALNRWGISRPLPYAVLGMVLWIFLHASGVHATLAGVILAVVAPARAPANLLALSAHTGALLTEEMAHDDDAARRHGPSPLTMRALDAIHDRIESPAERLLRSIEPWSSYVVLPLFALANAGVALSADVLRGHEMLALAIVVGLVVGKPAGIIAASAIAIRLGLAQKSEAYSWRHLVGAGVLAGIGFTMSLFIAGEAFPPAEYAAAKIAVFFASGLAGALGLAVLWGAPAQDG